MNSYNLTYLGNEIFHSCSQIYSDENVDAGSSNPISFSQDTPSKAESTCLNNIFAEVIALKTFCFDEITQLKIKVETLEKTHSTQNSIEHSRATN